MIVVRSNSLTMSTAAAPAAVAKRNPTDFLQSVLGRPVIIKLNSGVQYRGILACLDGYMNVALEQTEEYVDGQLKHKYGEFNEKAAALVTAVAC